MYSTGSYDPDPGDYIKACLWRYRPPGGDWIGPISQYRGEAGFLRLGVAPGDDQVGTWTFELTVIDSHDAMATTTATVKVEPGFAVRVDGVVPQPAEHGRNMIVRASAYRPDDGRPVAIDAMKVIIPTGNLPAGWQPHEAWMTYNPSRGMWEYIYLIPNRVQEGLWPDDGWYTVKVIGYRGGVIKEAYYEFRGARAHLEEADNTDRKLVSSYPGLGSPGPGVFVSSICPRGCFLKVSKCKPYLMGCNKNLVN